jgi:hypothetical protein
MDTYNSFSELVDAQTDDSTSSRLSYITHGQTRSDLFLARQTSDFF